MKRGIIYVVVGVIVVFAVIAAVKPVRQRARQIAADFKVISADTGDVMASATYQRFATRREAVLAMKKALVEVASIESVFVADSGRPITVLPPGGVKFDPHKIGVSIWLLRDRWVATAQTYGNFSNFSTMTCMITAMLDSTTLDSIKWRYHAAAPRCAEAYFNDSVLALLPPPPPLPAPVTADPGVTPGGDPHRVLDWGPVNNTPPRMPLIRKATCEGEGCTITGTWAACSTVAARADKRLDAALVFTIHPGERFTALTADLHVLEPGIVLFRRPFTTTVPIDESGLVDITFLPADTLFVLIDLGEGEVVWRYRGSTMRGEMFWAHEPPASSDTFGLVRPAKTVWWVRVRNATGQEGWLVGDYQKMATGGYMDEIERCLHPTKR